MQDTLGALGVNVNLGVANIAIYNARVRHPNPPVDMQGPRVIVTLIVRRLPLLMFMQQRRRSKVMLIVVVVCS